MLPRSISFHSQLTQDNSLPSFFFPRDSSADPPKGKPQTVVMLYWQELPPRPGLLEGQGGGWSQQ